MQSNCTAQRTKLWPSTLPELPTFSSIEHLYTIIRPWSVASFSASCIFRFNSWKREPFRCELNVTPIKNERGFVALFLCVYKLLPSPKLPMSRSVLPLMHSFTRLDTLNTVAPSPRLLDGSCTFQCQMDSALKVLYLNEMARWLKWLWREFSDQNICGSNPTSASRLPLSRLG
ncbi:hypothetical protein T265_07610 [Opisthorchis viverrini]|uniref:Uncharacterized protein n=1 Tax=Opisthorchis viverrini TaxID=6198 RepID=A0A074ZGN9_OPIVI|nr:hypothetical protein T265_07610 [Opisthorchis viverrini]KER24827.1 hypothetical protein T265_07610 [Opisthorchis viverrini]